MNDIPTAIKVNGKLDAAAYARLYKEAGVEVTYFEPYTKGPERKEWQKERWTLEEITGAFKDKNCGIILGPSGLVCVDADVPEAQQIMERALRVFLGKETLVGGRSGNPRSHLLYRVVGEIKHTIIDGPTGEVDKAGRAKTKRIIEILAGNHQVAVAPSIHPSGDVYDWAGDEFDPDKIATVNAEDLMRAVRTVALGAMINRAMPTGGRHEYALALAGLLLREDRVPRAVVEQAFEIGWGLNGYRNLSEKNEAERDYMRAIDTTEKKLAEKVSVTGGRTVNNYCPGLATYLLKAYGIDGNAWTSDESRVPQGETLMGIVDAKAELFHNPERTAYATVKVEGEDGTHRETMKVESSAFMDWLVGNFYKLTGSTPSSNAKADTRAGIIARAIYDGPEYSVWWRTARGSDGAIYIDLGTPDWSAVRVCAEGWEIIPSDDVPVKFVRGSTTGALPIPRKGEGNIGYLRELLNLETDEDFALCVAWVLQALKPEGPYPLLATIGQQGSAKSSNTRNLLALVDPSTAEDPLRTKPKEERDLLVAARNNWCLAYDNLSWLPESLSDAFCRLATGGAFGTRTLYENDKETLLSAKRPVIMNSIVGVINRPDLQERSIVVKAPKIPEEAREQESTMRANFETYSPYIFAAILDAMVATMAAPESDMEGGPRLIDFVRWAAPAIQYLGLGDFYEYFDAMRAEADLTALARDMVAGAIVLFMIEKEKFEGTTTELFTGILNDFRLIEVGSIDPKRWPRSPQAFGQWVTRCAPLLKSAGLTITDLPRSKGARKKLIQWAPGMTPDRRDEVLNAAEFPFHFITTLACENYVADAAERVGIELGQSRY